MHPAKIKLNTDWIKENSKLTHYFGLGFIQVKLSDTDRLHFYTDLLPKTVAQEEIHNHRYNFVSTILKGTFGQELYEVIPGDTHIITQETCNSNDKREFPKNPCAIEKVFENLYRPGEQYYIDHNTFHTVFSNFAITHVQRSGRYAKELADVVYPKNNEVVCPFSIKSEQVTLYEIIDAMIAK